MFKKCFTDIIMVAKATYFLNQAHFWKLFLMQTKYIRNVQKMFFAYYHGCYGNIPP